MAGPIENENRKKSVEIIQRKQENKYNEKRTMDTRTIRKKITPKIIIILFQAIMLCLSGCSEQNTVKKEYPFSLSGNASIQEYPADNIYALTSIITDINEDDRIWIFEFAKDSSIEEAKNFAIAAQTQKGIHGCNKDSLNIGAAHRYFETDDYFYVYLFYKKEKDVMSVCVDGDATFFWIDQLENGDIRLEIRQYMVVVDGVGGETMTVQTFEQATKEWSEKIYKWWPDEVGIF